MDTQYSDKFYGRWGIIFYFGKDLIRIRENGWNIFRFGIIKIHSFPEEGEMITKKHYYGFIIQFRLWLPIEKY